MKDSAVSRHIINQRMHNARGAEAPPPEDWSNSVDAESCRETLRSRLTQASRAPELMELIDFRKTNSW